MNNGWFASDLITPDDKPWGTPEMNTRKPRMASWRTTTSFSQGNFGVCRRVLIGF
jgi:hypothetical protein